MRRRPIVGMTLALGVLVAAIVFGQGKQVPDGGQTHIPSNQKGTYKERYPPTSGAHWGETWADWEMYDEPLPPEVFVHNLEHGGIVLLYRCATPCPRLVDQLRDLYRTFPKAKNGKVKMVVAPDPKIKPVIAVMAWAWIDELQKFDAERLRKFYIAHVDRGPEDVP